MNRIVKAWTHQDDADLMESIANGMTFEAAGRQIGRDKNAAIGRFNRMKKQMGEQAR